MMTARGGFGLASRSAAGREPGVRDFLKLCARVETLGVFHGQEEDESQVFILVCVCVFSARVRRRVMYKSYSSFFWRFGCRSLVL